MAKRAQFQNSTYSNNVAGDVVKNALKLGGVFETSGPVKSAAPKKKFQSTEAFTDAQIAADPTLSALKGGITYENALANYRKLTSVLNQAPMGGTKIKKGKTLNFNKLYNALTPEQKAAEKIFFALGGSTINAQGTGGAGTGVQTNLLNRLGIDTSTLPLYAPVKYTEGSGSKISFNNPLNAQQRERFQNLKKLNASSLSEKQKLALQRLKAKKNAPIILP